MSHIHLFISAVSDEFGNDREALRKDLDRHNVSVKIQQDFIASGTVTLDKLDLYISHCEAVIHLIGRMTGVMASEPSLAFLKKKYPDFDIRLPQLAAALAGKEPCSYTQWEAYLAIYHGKRLVIAAPDDAADARPHDPQAKHIDRLRQMGYHREIRFPNADRLALAVTKSTLPDLLARADNRQPAITLFSDGQSVPANFMARDEELEVIRQRLGEGGRLMLINAEGGIGKTTLAAKYWQQSRYDYERNAWLFCESGIINALKKLAPALDIDLSNMPEEAQLAALKAGLQNASHQFLLVLDNANDDTDIKAFEDSFMGFHWHVLITSRCAGVLDKAQEYPITNLPPEMAKELFKSNYEEEGPEFDALLDDLLERIGYHTLLTEIFSKYMRGLRKRSEGLKEFVARVEQGLFMEGRSLKVHTGYTASRHKDAATTDDILNILYDFSALAKAERRLLVNIALLPAVTYDFNFLSELLNGGGFHFEALEQLARKAWLAADEAGGYRISPVIQSIALIPSGRQVREGPFHAPPSGRGLFL